jgi:ATP-binding cassette subfamily B protein
VAAQDQAQVELAARLAGAHDLIMSLPQGYATQLGKWFAEGVELSGGEWQRIAMARAFLRRAPVIILDEPTSFLDSWAESDWFARLRALAHGHTSLLITHRFTIARRADLICVLERGQVVEIGTHAELLALGGRYAASWSRQIAQEETADPADVRAAQRGPAHDPALSPPSTSEMRPSQPALPPPAR